MQTEDFAKIGLGIVVIAAIGAGLATVGGPGTGRIEKRDSARLSDLQQLKRFVTCVARSSDNNVPDTLDPVPTCQQNLTTEDPFTGEAYVYRKLDDTTFDLCASFEAPERFSKWQQNELDLETGCIHWQHNS